MIIRQLKQVQFERLQKDLIQNANAEPLEASYTVPMSINDVEYTVRVQPETRHRIAVLQALRIERKEDSPSFELVTGSTILSSLLELLLYQGVSRRNIL